MPEYIQVLFNIFGDVIDDNVYRQIIESVKKIDDGIISVTHPIGTNTVDVSAKWNESELGKGYGICYTKWKTMLVGIAAIASIMAINTHGSIAFADPQHCDTSGWPSCYNAGFDNGKANPGTSCPGGHSKNYCRGWEHGSGISSNPGSRLVPDRESKSTTSDGSGGGKGTFKVTVEIFVSPRLSFDQKPPAFSVTIDGQQQGTEVHITENDERPMSKQLSDPLTSASSEFVLPQGQIPDGQSFNVCTKGTDSRFSFYDQCKTGFNNFGKKAQTVTFSIE